MQVINAIKVAFGEQTAKQWRTAKAGAIEVYDPFVETMEMWKVIKTFWSPLKFNHQFNLKNFSTIILCPDWLIQTSETQLLQFFNTEITRMIAWFFISRMSVTLIASDGVELKVDFEIIKQSKIVAGMLENLQQDNPTDLSDEQIPITNVTSAILKRIIEWCT